MRSLAVKLILAFLIVSLAGIVLVALVAGRATASEFGNFVLDQNQTLLSSALTAYYEANGTWDGVAQVVSPAGDGAGQGMGPGMGRGRGGSGGSGLGTGGNGMAGFGGMALVDGSGRVVLPGASYPVGTNVPPDVVERGAPIEVDGEVVGVLLAGRGQMEFTPAGAQFLERVNTALVVAAVGAGVLALALGVVLARTFTRPLREMTAATRAVAKGDLGRQVTVRSRDELGDLARSFNRMSADLAHAQERRQQLTADIAHDLRTPISVILGHAEALRDGVLPAGAETFDIIHDEAERLNRLVEDLRTLTQAESGELSLVPRPVAARTLLERTVAAQMPRAQQQTVALALDVASDLPAIDVDPDRMAQVLANLVENAIRHTPAGGRVTLSATATATHVRLQVADTGPGIPPEELPRLFERFYRGDKSRRRHQGGSGLGLAIAKSIVEGHGGRIWAESEVGTGATFVIEMPVTGNR